MATKLPVLWEREGLIALIRTDEMEDAYEDSECRIDPYPIHYWLTGQPDEDNPRQMIYEAWEGDEHGNCGIRVAIASGNPRKLLNWMRRCGDLVAYGPMLWDGTLRKRD